MREKSKRQISLAYSDEDTTHKDEMRGTQEIGRDNARSHFCVRPFFGGAVPEDVLAGKPGALHIEVSLATTPRRKKDTEVMISDIRVAFTHGRRSEGIFVKDTQRHHQFQVLEFDRIGARNPKSIM